MELKSTIVTLNNLLRMNFEQDFCDFVNPLKRTLSIPDYQREYKWDQTKIKIFIKNVMERSKFLGVITAEVSDGLCLSVVDGQQRLTTIMLMLTQLYNLCADEGETQTQNEIRELISCTIEGRTHFKLENGSVGEYIRFVEENNQSKIELAINPAVDIYKQAEKFQVACSTISSALLSRDQQITLDSYKQRLLDCEVLLFAQKNTSNLQQGSSEEIYIDINEKAQKLEPEDIFKGHCFAICKTIEQQSQVKILWREIKQQFFAMDGILKKSDMGAFLQFFLLTKEATKNDRKDIRKDLTVGNGGENIITDQYNTPTKTINLLTEMRKYQSSVLSFTRSLDTVNHMFAQIMNDTPQTIGNHREQLKEMTIILRDIIKCNQNLFKLPLFYFIDKNCNLLPEEKSNYSKLSAFIYLYYIYMFLFSRIGGSRKREDLPNKLIRQLYLGHGYLVQFIKEIIEYSNGFDFDDKAMRNEETRKQLYTILDFFKASSSTVPAIEDQSLNLKLGLFPDTYNLEHLIINQSHTINWRSARYNAASPVPDTEYDFSAADFSPCPAWTSPNNCWTNFIWIDEIYNRDSLKNKDIINKLILLRGNATIGELPSTGSYAKKHLHIEILCQHIMSTPGFSQLLTKYHNNESRANVLDCYRVFINNYFDESNIDRLRANCKDYFADILQSLQQLIQEP